MKRKKERNKKRIHRSGACRRVVYLPRSSFRDRSDSTGRRRSRFTCTRARTTGRGAQRGCLLAGTPTGIRIQRAARCFFFFFLPFSDRIVYRIYYVKRFWDLHRTLPNRVIYASCPTDCYNTSEDWESNGIIKKWYDNRIIVLLPKKKKTIIAHVTCP